MAPHRVIATGDCSPFVENLIDSMLSMGRPIPAIINAAIARERDGEANPF